MSLPGPLEELITPVSAMLERANTVDAGMQCRNAIRHLQEALSLTTPSEPTAAALEHCIDQISSLQSELERGPFEGEANALSQARVLAKQAVQDYAAHLMYSRPSEKAVKLGMGWL
jgi:hypothetical protein